MVAELLQIQCGPLCSFFLPICLVQYSFSCILDTKFCLHAAGGVFVYDNFEHLAGTIQISGSSAKGRGGAMLRSSSWGLRHDWDGCRFKKINSRVWNRKNWRDFHQRSRQSLIANWVKSWRFVVVPACYLSRQAGCLFGSISPFEYDRYLKQDSKPFFCLICRKICNVVDSLLIWCQWWSIAFLTLTTFGKTWPCPCYLTELWFD